MDFVLWVSGFGFQVSGLGRIGWGKASTPKHKTQSTASGKSRNLSTLEVLLAIERLEQRTLSTKVDSLTPQTQLVNLRIPPHVEWGSSQPADAGGLSGD